jgi:hypothetical protein
MLEYPTIHLTAGDLTLTGPSFHAASEVGTLVNYGGRARTGWCVGGNAAVAPGNAKYPGCLYHSRDHRAYLGGHTGISAVSGD